MRPMREKMHTGELYLPNDDEIFQDQIKKLDRLYDFNMTRPTQLDKRTEMLKEMFAEIGENCYIEPPLHANMAGAHVHFGKNVYANFNLTLVDDSHDRTERNDCNCRTSDPSRAPGEGISVQYAGTYRKELLAGGRSSCVARSYHW